MNLRLTVSLFSEFCIDDRLKEIFKVIFKGPVIVYRLGLGEEGGGVRCMLGCWPSTSRFSRKDDLDEARL